MCLGDSIIDSRIFSFLLFFLGAMGVCTGSSCLLPFFTWQGKEFFHGPWFCLSPPHLPCLFFKKFFMEEALPLPPPSLSDFGPFH
jgi:hypothetical protein